MRTFLLACLLPTRAFEMQGGDPLLKSAGTDKASAALCRARTMRNAPNHP